MHINGLDADRFWSKVDIRGPYACWNWRAGGRGVFSLNGKSITAARVAYAIQHGSVPAGMQVNHRCDNRSCVNPRHLYAGTQMDNVRDMHLRGRFVGRRKSPETTGHMNPNSKFQDWQVALAVYLVSSGFSFKEAAVEIGASVSSVREWATSNVRGWIFQCT